MVTLASPQPQRRQKRSATSTQVNGFPRENELKDLRFKLAHNLQSTLDLNTALELFFTNIQDLVPTEGLIYSYEDEAVEINLGKEQRHTAAYKIASSNTYLGEITFSRTKRFVETELAIMEMLIGALFFPLRNALLYRQALQSSMRDTLTGIGNRASMDNNISREIKLARRHQHPLSLLMIDVDHFKQVNDDNGHRNGDKTLQHIVKTIRDTLRETDQIFRYGGEEFVALLNNTDYCQARLIAERIRLNIAMSPIALESQDLLVTASIGVSHLNAGDTPETLFQKADEALYIAKSTGRNKVVVGTDNDIKKDIATSKSA